MSAKLLPFNELPPEMGTLELPDYVPTERIGINMPLLSRIAGWACCKPMVKLDMYTGSTTQYDPGISGIMDDGTAAFGLNATRDKHEAKLATHAFSDYDPSNNQCEHLLLDTSAMLHQIPQLHVKYNLAEMDNRLGLYKANRRDPKPWAALLNRGAGMAIAAASKEHLLRGGRKTASELTDASLIGISAVATSITAAAFNLLPADSWIGAPFTVMLLSNLGKMNEVKKGRLDTHGVCFSLIPGHHLDRLLVARTLPKMRRIFRVLPPRAVTRPAEATEDA